MILLQMDAGSQTGSQQRRERKQLPAVKLLWQEKERKEKKRRRREEKTAAAATTGERNEWEATSRSGSKTWREKGRKGRRPACNGKGIRRKGNPWSLLWGNRKCIQLFCSCCFFFCPVLSLVILSFLSLLDLLTLLWFILKLYLGFPPENIWGKGREKRQEKRTRREKKGVKKRTGKKSWRVFGGGWMRIVCRLD